MDTTTPGMLCSLCPRMAIGEGMLGTTSGPVCARCALELYDAGGTLDPFDGIDLPNGLETLREMAEADA